MSYSSTVNKSMTHSTQPSRQTITTWIHNILPDVPVNLRVEELGKGVIYCRIINYYFPGVILINRIIWQPKSQYENTLNLRIAQNAMGQLKIIVPIDPIKLSKQKLNDNWTFVSGLHRYLTHTQEEIHPSPLMEERSTYGFYPQKMTPSHSNFALPSLKTPKRSLEQVYSSDSFFPQMMRQPFYPIDSNFQQKTFNNASKYSVGKLYKESSSVQTVTSSPNKGKWSVNSHMFQNNLAPIIDRVKEILLKSSHDTERVRQIKMLLNIPLNEEVMVKVEEDENSPIIAISDAGRRADKVSKEQEQDKENKIESESLIETKAEIKS